MKISATTFDDQLRERLLDVLYAQWRDLGFPFSHGVTGSVEVIDPEALLWCSLEFLPSEPRLREAALQWFDAHGIDLIRQRLNSRAKDDDARATFWNALNQLTSTPPASAPLPHGLNSAGEVAEFAQKLIHDVRDPDPAPKLGRHGTAPSTLLIQARNLLGADTRHFLLVFLLANPGGGKLRDLANWCGYSYRGISEAATRWQAAGAVTIDHGFCRLTEFSPWETLLRRAVERIVLVNWFELFDACVELLRGLAKVRLKGLPPDGPVASGLRREALQAISAAVLNGPADKSRSITHLRDVFSPEDHIRASA